MRTPKRRIRGGESAFLRKECQVFRKEFSRERRQRRLAERT